ncbi:hypothetical protein BDZ89DRAFT_231447 [Hymenopellis radicata]|nr:hypothetical protein BDZ89DRAFT_231447 [Hymenopellis radicata]
MIYCWTCIMILNLRSVSSRAFTAGGTRSQLYTTLQILVDLSGCRSVPAPGVMESRTAFKVEFIPTRKNEGRASYTTAQVRLSRTNRLVSAMANAFSGIGNNEPDHRIFRMQRVFFILLSMACRRPMSICILGSVSTTRLGPSLTVGSFPYVLDVGMFTGFITGLVKD